MLSPFTFDAGNAPHDYHGCVSVTWAELEDCGFVDWDAPEWQWDAYDDAQRERLQEKISARYEFREIGILPWARFRRQLVRKLNEVMPKYKLLYKKLEDSATDLFVTSDTHSKDRRVFSDFPATLLNTENQDYAANATDNEGESVTYADTFERMQDIAGRYNDIDVMVLDELEVLFSSLMTVSFNGL